MNLAAGVRAEGRRALRRLGGVQEGAGLGWRRQRPCSEGSSPRPAVGQGGLDSSWQRLERRLVDESALSLMSAALLVIAGLGRVLPVPMAGLRGVRAVVAASALKPCKALFPGILDAPYSIDGRVGFR